MEAPTISIKIKGLDAIEALSKKGILGGLKVKGAGAASLKIGELEAKRVLVTKKGLVLQEIEGHAIFNVPKAATKGAITKGATLGKSAVVVKGAKSVMVPGAAMSAKGLGWSLGWGVGPWLALAALSLAGMGVYFYLRAQAMERKPPELEDLDVPT